MVESNLPLQEPKFPNDPNATVEEIPKGSTSSIPKKRKARKKSSTGSSTKVKVDSKFENKNKDMPTAKMPPNSEKGIEILTAPEKAAHEENPSPFNAVAIELPSKY